MFLLVMCGVVVCTWIYGTCGCMYVDMWDVWLYVRRYLDVWVGLQTRAVVAGLFLVSK